MKLPTFFGKLKSNKPFIVRRVAGASMSPKLRPGQLLIATRFFRHVHPGQVVIIAHQGREKVKRIERIADDKIYVIGDNLDASTDSRHFGWLSEQKVVGRVFWPKLAK